eukprot:Opistho-2@76553
MSAFHQSTQKTHWTFASETELDSIRALANQNAKDAIFVVFYERRDLKSPTLEEYLTPQEERLLCSFYEHKLQDVCSVLQRPPPTVMSTAMTYFRRFYLRNSVMNYHPKDIMLSCVYLATKTDEFYVKITDFVEGVVPGPPDEPKVKKNRESMVESIRAHEVLVMRENKFHLVVHSPYRALRGVILDLKMRQTDLRLDFDELSAGSERVIDRLYLTDAILLQPPSVLALAAVIHAAKTLGSNVESYVKVTLGSMAPTPEALAVLERRLADTHEYIDMDVAVDELSARTVDKKLRVCRNPSTNIRSDTYKKSQVAKDAANEDKRMAEIEASKKRRAQNDEECEALVGKSDGDTPSKRARTEGAEGAR